MKINIVLAFFAGAIASATAQYFACIAARSGAPFHLASITAAGERLYLGGNTATYCPSNIQSLGDCPPLSNETNFAGGQGSLYMGALVPGGQQVYVEPTYGAVMYAQAHLYYMPNGSITNGWSYNQSTSYGVLSWEGGLLACNSSQGGPYEVYGNLDHVSPPGDCLGFDALCTNQTSADAWQYV